MRRNLLSRCCAIALLVSASPLALGQTNNIPVLDTEGHRFEIMQQVPQVQPVDTVQSITVAEPDWFVAGRMSPAAQQALTILEQAPTQGLNAKRYQYPALKSQIEQMLQGDLDATQISALNQRFNQQFINYVLDLKNGQVRPEDVKQKFNRTIWTREQAQQFVNDAVARDDLAPSLTRLMSAIPMYHTLTKVLADYRTLENHPAWQTPLSGSANPGQGYKQLDVLVARLQALGDLGSSEAIPDTYSGVIVEATKRFQQRHGFKGDGKLDKATITSLNVTPAQRIEQIELSLERLRWTPLMTGNRMIVVNIPEFVLRAYAVEHQKISTPLEMRVIVGKSFSTSTPLFDGQLSAIEFSPYWNIPPSIARSETIPKIRANPGYLKASGMEFVYGNSVSTVASAANIQAVLSGKARIRQRPGPRNALGDIKFIFPNNQNIYLHHTPSTGLFDRSRRDLSHGCIRVEEPVELAQFVLSKQPEWTQTRIKNAMEGRKSSTIKVVDPVTVVLAYSTVVTKNGQVYFYNDIYGQDALLAKALARRKP